MRTAFSYYGGKGMISGLYPEPLYKTIIEPFAGGAAYACRWYQHNVILYDINPIVCDIWGFIRQKKSIKLMDCVPINVDPGDKLSEIIDISSIPNGMAWFLRSAVNVGTMGIGSRKAKEFNTITKLAAKNWHHNTIDKVRYWHPRIQHWKIINGSYIDCPDVNATWFIDPPYNNVAGARYLCNDIDHNHLGNWVRKRKGQIIVCENSGAGWLPFKNHCHSPKINSNKPRSKTGEVIYYRKN